VVVVAGEAQVWAQVSGAMPRALRSRALAPSLGPSLARAFSRSRARGRRPRGPLLVVARVPCERPPRGRRAELRELAARRELCAHSQHVKRLRHAQQQRETESEPKALHQSSGMPDMASHSKRRTTAIASSKGNS
jgi:hypothetical protein